jgi:acetylornithine deacetylase/succinyl-diaminopimelate desuccinylase-like protein
MKGGLAAFVGALKVVERFGALRETPVSLVVTGDEEVGSARGMIPLLREGLVTGKWAICGEPTSLKIFTGNRGVIWLRVEVEGKGGHAGMAHTLENPVVGAALIIQALNALPLEAYDERFDPPTPSLTVTSMYPNGPPVANTVPDSVTIAVDRRLLPGEIPEIVVSDIERAISGIASENISARVLVDWTQPAYVCNSSDSLVFIMQSIVRTVGRDDLLGTDPAVDDSSWLGSAGISTILYGPGAPDQAHATNETVLIAEVRDAIEIYARLILAASNRRL